ncbi:MAG: hypothetical protein GYB68_17115 [Chloroflexi bacterium]|nr:hypothetical protein [Chloroflexota bacterium]
MIKRLSIVVAISIAALVGLAGCFTTDSAEDLPEGWPFYETPDPTPIPEFVVNLPGAYAIAGTQPSGDTYEGAMTIEENGEAYRVTWDVQGVSQTGVGVLRANILTVAFPEGCTATIYERQPELRLIGFWSDGSGTVQREEAIPIPEIEPERETIDQVYVLRGEEANGETYTIQLSIRFLDDADDVLVMRWRVTETNDVEGVGLLEGDLLSAANPVECGVYSYQIDENGDLNGRWAFFGIATEGFESAVKDE